MEKYTLKRKIFLGVKIFIIVIVLIVFSYSLRTHRMIKSGDLVEFQGHWYTKEQLRQILPPQYAPLKEPINTTEEVYTQFREALLVGEIEKALSFIREEDRERFRSDFYNEEDIKLYLDIPEYSELIQDDYMENFQKGYRYYVEGNDTPYTVSFKLNQRTALWEIVGI